MAPHESELHTDEVANYLYQSIADTQGTIRATDIKIGFLLVILFAPVVAFDKVEPYLRMVFREGVIQHWLILAAVLFWGLSLVTQFMALFAISNPAKKVRGGPSEEGTFYSGDLFRLGLVDLIINRTRSARLTIRQETERLPKTQKALVEDLTFEKMKLVYIRSMKLARLNAAVTLLVAGLILFGASYALHLAK